jgi:hypothetical protein
VVNLTGFVSWVISLAVLALAAWALVDCITRPTRAFLAASKLTKPAWLAITAGALGILLLFSPLHVFGIAAIVASVVYLVDVRPAVREVQGGQGRW